MTPLEVSIPLRVILAVISYGYVKKLKPHFGYLQAMMKIITSALSFLLSVPVYIYRYTISPFLRPSCRHIPSCSQYMLDALKIHGPFYGFAMGLNRILRCRPGGTHGYDPVPLFRFKKYNGRKRYSKCNRLKESL